MRFGCFPHPVPAVAAGGPKKKCCTGKCARPWVRWPPVHITQAETESRYRFRMERTVGT